MNNRMKTLTISLVAVTLVFAFSAFIAGYQMVERQTKLQYLQSQITLFRNSTANVRIENISAGSWYPDPIGWSPYYKDFNITVVNNGIVKTGGMILEAKVQGNNTNLDSDLYGMYISNQIGVLQVQESNSMSIRLIANMQRADILSQYSLSITLSLDGVVHDKQTVEIGK